MPSLEPPIGEVVAYGGASAPTNFLICDGSAISRADYADLFDVIGTTFGSGNGTTTFNIPNLVGKIMVGWKSGDSNFGTVGNANGADTINLAHSHTQNAHTHTISGTTGDRSAGQNIYAGGGTCSPNSHTHTFSFTSGAASDLGTSSSLSATQSTANPFVVVNFIIRYKISEAQPGFLLEIV